jgi:NitT/TauT family transport system permease protein
VSAGGDAGKPDWRGIALPAATLLLAEVAARVVGITSESLAAPSDMALAFGEALGDGSLLRATWETVAAAVAGLLAGGLLGLGIGIWFGLSRTARRLALWPVELLRPLPSVAMIPIAMMIFGFGYRMEILVVAFTCFWPMLLLTESAVRHVEPCLYEVAHMLGLTTPARVFKIVLPAALPRIFVAFRLAAGISLVVAVTVEVAANPAGLGYALMLAQQSLHPDLMFALLLWVGFVGWASNCLLLAIQRRLFSHVAGAQA